MSTNAQKDIKIYPLHGGDSVKEEKCFNLKPRHLFIGAILTATVISGIAYLFYMAHVGNTARIKAIGVSVEPDYLNWGDFIYGQAENKTRVLNITNTQNTMVNVSFSDDLQIYVTGAALYMEHPDNFTLAIGESILKTVKLVYDGGYGTDVPQIVSWTITVTAEETPG